MLDSVQFEPYRYISFHCTRLVVIQMVKKFHVRAQDTLQEDPNPRTLQSSFCSLSKTHKPHTYISAYQVVLYLG